MKQIEENGGRVTRGSLDAKAPLPEQNRKVRTLVGSGEHIFFTWFEGDSVLEELKISSPGFTIWQPGRRLIIWRRLETGCLRSEEALLIFYVNIIFCWSMRMEAASLWMCLFSNQKRSHREPGRS